MRMPSIGTKQTAVATAATSPSVNTSSNVINVQRQAMQLRCVDIAAPERLLIAGGSYIGVRRLRCLNATTLF